MKFDHEIDYPLVSFEALEETYDCAKNTLDLPNMQNFAAAVQIYEEKKIELSKYIYRYVKAVHGNQLHAPWQNIFGIYEKGRQQYWKYRKERTAL